jgi:hypothetical protein
MMGISKDETFPKKRRKVKITFNEDEEVINPEDIDPSVGRFRNMVTTTVIPNRSFSLSQRARRDLVFCQFFSVFQCISPKYRYLTAIKPCRVRVQTKSSVPDPYILVRRYFGTDPDPRICMVPNSDKWIQLRFLLSDLQDANKK